MSDPETAICSHCGFDNSEWLNSGEPDDPEYLAALADAGIEEGSHTGFICSECGEENDT